MKIVIGIIIIFFIGIGFYFKDFFKKLDLPTETQQVTIDGKKYTVLIADSQIEYTNGLMHVRKLDNADGMIFIFPKPRVQIFWNHNTFVDLDVYWMRGDQIVGHDSLPSIEKSKSTVIIQSNVPADRVVEIIRK